MRERKVGGGQCYSVEGHVLGEETHGRFFFMNPFSFVSKRVVHTGDWLLTCFIHSDD